MDCRVVLEAAVPVYDVSDPDEAVRIAVSKTGKMLNPDLSYVEIDMGERRCPDCGAERKPAFVAADEGLVALELSMTVFNVEGEQHATRIARKEIGERLDDVPLEVLRVEEDEGKESATDTEGETEQSSEPATEESSDSGEDLLPEFDELIEDG